MSNAYKCPIEGTLHEGIGPRTVNVDLGNGTMVEARVYQVEGGSPGRYQYGDRMISPEGVKRIAAALATLKRDDAAKGGKVS
jgi:hypothetical protein